MRVGHGIVRAVVHGMRTICYGAVPFGGRGERPHKTRESGLTQPSKRLPRICAWRYVAMANFLKAFSCQCSDLSGRRFCSNRNAEPTPRNCLHLGYKSSNAARVEFLQVAEQAAAAQGADGHLYSCCEYFQETSTRRSERQGTASSRSSSW